jgi:acyl transferase domain-containing protein
MALRVNVDADRAWPQTYARRCAAVSSFGINGSNAHVVLEQAPLPASDTGIPANETVGEARLLSLSAKDEISLRAQARQYAALLPRPGAAARRLLHGRHRARAFPLAPGGHR